MPEQTGCWNCNKLYPHDERGCPFCGATNGNVDFERASTEAQGLSPVAPQTPKAREEST